MASAGTDVPMGDSDATAVPATGDGDATVGDCDGEEECDGEESSATGSAVSIDSAERFFELDFCSVEGAEVVLKRTVGGMDRMSGRTGSFIFSGVMGGVMIDPYLGLLMGEGNGELIGEGKVSVSAAVSAVAAVGDVREDTAVKESKGANALVRFLEDMAMLTIL